MNRQLISSLAIPLLSTGLGFSSQAQAGTPATKFRPDEIMISGHFGIAGSRMESRGEMKYYFDPIGKAQPLVTANFGVSTEFRWRSFMFSLGAWHERVGQFTPGTQVAFQGNPFPHDFETETWANQFVVPLQTGFGISGRRHHFFVQTGIYGALLSDQHLEWKVDGASYTGAPKPWITDGDKGWLLGVEYGLRLGRGILLLNLSSRRSFSSIATNVDGRIANGTARVASGSVSAGYGYSFWPRR